MPNGTTTITGILISILPLIANSFGYDTGPNFNGDVSEIIAACVSLIGTTVALYGRAKAKGPLFVKHSPTL